MEIYKGRYTALVEGDFVVFLLGAQLHKPWKVRQWLPVGRAMLTMQRELADHPEIGCLRIENYGMFRGVSVQYWRSFEHLERFARSDEWSHLEAWKKFNRLIRDSGDLGIWHETYLVPAGSFEAIYGNMPRVGLAAAGAHERLGRGVSAATRLRVREEDRAPVDSY